MSCERFDDKTVWVLSGLYRKVLGRTRVNEKTCLGCHTREIKCYEKISQEKNKKNGYCSQECQIGYYSLIYDMGQKRVREQARERPDFRQLLEMLDEPVIAQIITYTYPLYREEIGDMRAILDLRGESQQLRDLIDRQILREIRELSPEIAQILTNDSLSLFPNLRTLYLMSPENEVNDIRQLTNLEHLEIGELIGDDSLMHLQKLTKLLVLGDSPITGNSLSTLTQLEILLFMENNHLSDDILLELPSLSLVSLILIKCPEIHRAGFFHLSNLTSLELESININDQALSRMRNLKNLRITGNEEFLGDLDSLGNMPLLEVLVLVQCPNFEGNGLRYKSPLNMLVAGGTKVNNSALASQIHLTTLDISKTAITDERLSEFTNLKRLSVRNSLRITDQSLEKLTLLEFLDLTGSQRVSRKVLSKLTNLEELYLDRTSMSPGKYDPVLKLPNLRVLSLGDTKAILSREMVSFTNLVELSLAFNEVIQGKAYLRNLTTLTKLDLSHNQLIENEDIKMFTRLESLNLKGNTLIKSYGLRNMPNLREIVLRDGTVTDDFTWVDYA